MYLGVDLIRAGDACLLLGGNVESGDFFNGLRKKETQHGEIFKNGKGEQIKLFPERLTVKIDAALDKCMEGKADRYDRSDIALSTSLMNSLQFDAYWKLGFEMQKADVDVLRRERSNDLGPKKNLWKYELSIRSEDIPLTRSLVIVLQTPEGKIISRLSGKP